MTLDHELRALGRAVPGPSGEQLDALVGAVLVRVADEPVPVARRGVRGWLRDRWRALVAGLTGVVVVLALTPPVRAAVADFFGFAGVVVHTTPAGPADPTEPVGPAPSATGTDLASARAMVGFPVAVPGELGEPDGVEVSGDRRVVSMSWGGVRLDQFDGALSPAFAKRAGDVDWVVVRGEQALWFPRPHEVLVMDRDGSERTETARTSGRTLIWQLGAVTLRLEGDLDLVRALAIAESVRG
jgi:hypothetical protein